MKNWRVVFGLSLVVITVALYFIHYAIFRDVRHIFIYLLGDIAFLPVQVLLVTLVIDKLLKAREKQVMLQKLNMVIGTFFSDVGVKLIRSCVTFDNSIDAIRQQVAKPGDWSATDFDRAAGALSVYQPAVDSRRGDLVELRDFLQAKRDFLLRLLENQNLLEHESFTDLLWAVFHLADELAHRGHLDLRHLARTDSDHLSGDIKRAYIALIIEWTQYLKHLKKRYPYLFSLALRTNPFDPQSSIEVG